MFDLTRMSQTLIISTLFRTECDIHNLKRLKSILFSMFYNIICKGYFKKNNIFTEMHPAFRNAINGNPGDFSPYGGSAFAPFHALTGSRESTTQLTTFY